jgi:hypothetical protein
MRYMKKGFEFFLIYTKEPHPGENISQPATFEKRAKNAIRLKQEEKVNFPILIDTRTMRLETPIAAGPTEFLL